MATGLSRLFEAEAASKPSMLRNTCQELRYTGLNESFPVAHLTLMERAQNDTNSEVEIDLDEVLDMESDPIRRDFLLSKLHGAKKSRQDVEEFVKELLTRAKTL